jgi:hypothetical protein
MFGTGFGLVVSALLGSWGNFEVYVHGEWNHNATFASMELEGDPVGSLCSHFITMELLLIDNFA